MPLSTRVSILSLVCLAVATASGPAAAHGPMIMHQSSIHFDLASDTVEIPMRREDGRVILDVMLDGKGPYPFIFDTGAHGSVLDLAFARELGLALGAEVMVGSPGGKGRPGSMVTLHTVGIGGLTLTDVTSIAFDGMPFPRTATSPRGVLGPYGLNGLLITLDYPGQKLVFRRGELPQPDQREVFAWEPSRGLPEIPVTVAGQAMMVHLDSGASRALHLPVAFAAKLKLDGPLRDMGYAKTVDQVQPVRGAALVGSVTLGRYTLEHPTIAFVDMAKDVGNVGAAILSQFALTIDPANTRLQLAGPADGAITAPPDPRPHYGLQLDALEANPLRVVVVDEDSPAKRGGLHAGDRIVQINGRKVEELAVDDRLAALKATPLQVTVQRGEDTVGVTMTLP